MYELEERVKEVPALRKKLSEQCKKWLDDKAQFEAMDKQVLEIAKAAADTKERRVAMEKRVLLYQKLQSDKESLAKEEKRLNTIVSRDEQEHYLLRAVPFLNSSYKFRSEIEVIDNELRQKPTDGELKKRREEMTKAIRTLSQEYVQQFFPELAQKQRQKERKRAKAHQHEAPAAAMQFSSLSASASSSSLHSMDETPMEIGEDRMMDLESEHGEDESYLGNELSNASYEQIRQLCPQRQFTYRRINHFREYLRQIQGKSRANIPQSIYEDLKTEFAKTKTDLATVHPRMVRAKLKKLRQSKYYEHIESITHNLNPAYKPIDIDVGREEKLCFMFTQLEAPYEKIKKQVKKTRKNFLSYPFTFFKLCELNAWDEYLRAAYLLKSPSLLVEQDRWWSLVCAELQWEYCGRTVDMITKR